MKSVSTGPMRAISNAARVTLRLWCSTKLPWGLVFQQDVCWTSWQRNCWPQCQPSPMVFGFAFNLSRTEFPMLAVVVEHCLRPIWRYIADRVVLASWERPWSLVACNDCQKLLRRCFGQSEVAAKYAKASRMPSVLRTFRYFASAAASSNVQSAKFTKRSSSSRTVSLRGIHPIHQAHQFEPRQLGKPAGDCSSTYRAYPHTPKHSASRQTLRGPVQGLLRSELGR